MTTRSFGPFRLDEQRGVLTREGEPVALGQRGLALLSALLAADGKAVDKQTLMDAAWPGVAVEESNLSVQIAALRKLLGPPPHGGEWIATLPRVGYRFTGAGESSHRPAPPTDSSSRPRIAVLPFANLSGDTDQEYLADGITEDIITALARFRWFQVIARNSSFAYKGKTMDTPRIAEELEVAYLLQGSLRKSGAMVRISAQLVDAMGGTHVWAERYDLEMTELFAIQDEIAERVAGAAEPELLRSDSTLAAARHTGNMAAWDLVRRGTWHFHQLTRKDHLAARALFREACQIDPRLPESHIWLARVTAGILAYHWSDDVAGDRREGLEAARQALHLDDANPYSHYAMAIISNFSNAPEQGLRAAERTVALSPSFAMGHLGLGMARVFLEDAANAIEPLRHGIRLSPFDPQNFAWHYFIGLAHLMDGDAEAGLQSTLRACGIRPSWSPAVRLAICCYASLGQWDEARRYAETLEDCDPAWGDVLSPLRERNSPWPDRIADYVNQARATAGKKPQVRSLEPGAPGS